MAFTRRDRGPGSNSIYSALKDIINISTSVLWNLSWFQRNIIISAYIQFHELDFLRIMIFYITRLSLVNYVQFYLQERKKKLYRFLFIKIATINCLHSNHLTVTIGVLTTYIIEFFRFFHYLFSGNNPFEKSLKLLEVLWTLLNWIKNVEIFQNFSTKRWTAATFSIYSAFDSLSSHRIVIFVTVDLLYLLSIF